MQQLENLHRAIVTADAAAANDDILPHAHLTPAEQISIYIDAYRLRLIDAVTSTFPCLQDYLGTSAMTPLTKSYVEAVPPRSYNLDFYPFGFADYIRAKIPAPAAALAELEGTIAEIFMRPDSPPLAADILTRCTPTELGDKVFHVRPALRLLHLSHDAETFWQNHKQGHKLPEIAPQPVFLCVCRHHHDVLRHRLDPGAYALLQELYDGKSFNAAIATVIDRGIITEAELAQEISLWLPQWLNAGFFRA